MKIESREKRRNQDRGHVDDDRACAQIWKAHFLSSKMFVLWFSWFIFQELGPKGDITDLLSLIRNSWGQMYSKFQNFSGF